MANKHKSEYISCFIFLIVSHACVYVCAWEYNCSMDPTSTYLFPPPCLASGNHNSSSNNTANSTIKAFSLLTLEDPSLSRSNGSLNSSSSSNTSSTASNVGSSNSNSNSSSNPSPPPTPKPCDPNKQSMKLLSCCLTLEYVACEFLSSAAFGRSVADMDATLYTNASCRSVGGEKAICSDYYTDVLRQLAFQCLDHIRVVKLTFSDKHQPNCPSTDISKENFAEIVNKAVGKDLWPVFDYYKSDLHTLLGAYWFQGLLTKCYVGILGRMEGPTAKRLCGSLAAAKAGQEAIVRKSLYDRLEEPVHPYAITVAEFTNKLSLYRDQLLGSQGCSDEGLWTPPCLGSGANPGNMMSLDGYSLPYSMPVVDNCEIVKAALGKMLLDGPFLAP